MVMINGRDVRGNLTPFNAKDKYSDDMPFRCYALLAAGKSKAAVCAEFMITKATFEKWTSPESTTYKPLLAAAYEKGLVASEAWWEESSIKNIDSRHYQDRVFAMTMRNRFGWRNNDSVVPAEKTTDDIVSVLSKLVDKLPV